jgi:hypothetical protein
MVTGCDDEKTGIPSAPHNFTRRLDDVDSPHVANASHSAYSRALSRDRRKSLTEPLAIFFYGSKKIGICKSSHDVIRYRRNERSAAESRSMITGLYRLGNFGSHERRAHRQSTRNGLGESHHVRSNAEPFVGHECAQSSEAALNFVEDERDLALLRQPADVPQELGIEHANAAFALDWLHD